MLEITEESFKLRLFGEEVSLPYPTLDQVDALVKKQSDPEFQGKELSFMRQFFSELGLKEEHLKRLQIPHYTTIFEELVKKKN